MDQHHGLHLRPWRGAEDLPAMARVANASFAADSIEIRRTAQEMARDYAAMRDWDPQRDVMLAEAGGELVGYARTWNWRQHDGALVFGQLAFVPPAWRRRGVGRMLHAWLEGRQRAIAAGHPEAASFVHHAYTTEGETSRVQLLLKAGYRPVRHFLAMVRHDLGHIPDFPLPAGVEVRTVQPGHHRAIYDAHVEALRGHWGFAPPGAGDYEAWLGSRVFQPQLWQVAWDLERDTVVGQVKPFIDSEYNVAFGRARGWTEFISVAEGWRKRGLARALVARALRAQRDAGMTESALGVDSANPHGASRIYADCGFRVTQRNCVYRKPMAL